MTPRLDEIKVRLAEAKAGGSYKLNMDDLAWLIEENAKLRAELDEECRLLGAGGSRELALMTERDKLREENERLLRNERNGAKDIVIAKLRADLALACEGLEKLSLEVSEAINGIYRGFVGNAEHDLRAANVVVKATLERLGRKG